MTAPSSKRDGAVAAGARSADARAAWRLAPGYLAAYTALFAIGAVLAFAPFALAGKSLVWMVDGLDQHFNAFVWLGATVCEIARGVLEGHGLVIPLWEWGLGYGGDAIGTLSYYVIGDSFALISVAFPAAHAEAGYAISIIARLWCAGAALSVYCRGHGCRRGSTLVAALAYAFCAFALYGAVRHPYFANPLIYLPLILDGLERVLEGGSAVRYTAWVAVAAASNYYFLYMLLIVAVLYGAVRYPALPGATPRGFARAFGRSALFTLLGVGIAGAIFIPSAYAFLTCSRDTAAFAVDPHYPLSYYRELLRSAFTSASPGYWTNIGIAPVGVLSMATLAAAALGRGTGDDTGNGSERREARWQLALAALLAVFLLFPFFGHALNGFGYATNRWTFAWAFLAAAVIARWLPALAEAPRTRRLKIAGAALAVCTAGIAFAGTADRAATLSAIALAALLVPLAFWDKGTTFLCPTFLCPILVVLASVGIMAHYQYASTGYLQQFHDADTDLAQLQQAASPVFDAGKAQAEHAPVDASGSFYRIDRPSLVNALAASHVSATSAYWSVMPAGIGSFMQENASYQFESYTFLSLENRSLLLPLANARYYVLDASTRASNAVPYGYTEVSTQTDAKTGLESTLYESRLALPFGWTSASFISQRDYERATIPQRQQMLLQGIVLDDGAAAGDADVGGLKRATPAFTDEELPFTVTKLTGATWDGATLTATEPGATIELAFDCPAGAELYVQMLDAAFTATGDAGARPTLSWATAASAGKQGRARMLTPYDAGFDGRRDYLLNIGYSTDARSGATLTFSEPGTYEIGSLSVVAQPVAQMDAQIDALRAQPLENVRFEANRITGDIDLTETRALCLSLPYSEGWSATVDGAPAKLVRADGMYTGLVLGPGSHRIELTYMTPYLPAGIAVSAASLAIAVAYGALGHRDRRVNSGVGDNRGAHVKRVTTEDLR